MPCSLVSAIVITLVLGLSVPGLAERTASLAMDSEPVSRELGKSSIDRDAHVLRESDAPMERLALRRPCFAERPCPLSFSEPVSSREASVSTAEHLTVALILNLSQREGLCVEDTEGRWSKRTGERLRPCPYPDEPHQVRVRVDPAADGFLATVSFTETAHPQGTSSSPAERDKPATVQDSFDSPPLIHLRLRTLFDEERDVTFAADRIADALGDALGTVKPSLFDVFLKPPEVPFLHVNLKLGNTLAALEGFDISAFTLRFDIELDYYIRPYLTAFIEVGLAIGNAQNTSSDKAKDDSEVLSENEDSGDSDEKGSGKGSFSLVPVKIGLKYNPLYQYALRPYAGVGIGLGILSDLVEANSREVTLSLSGIFGVAWIPFNHLGFNLETSLNFDELRISGGSNVLFGFSINFGVLFLF